MGKCVICSKKLNVFNIRSGFQLKTGECICISCANKLDKNTLHNFNNLDKDDLNQVSIENQKKCCICQEPLTILNTGINNRLKTGEQICIHCIKKLDDDTVWNLKNLTIDNVRLKYSNQEQRYSISSRNDVPKKNVVVEYKRTCNQCGKVWHVLAEREKYLEREKKFNNCNMCASAFSTAGGDSNSWGTWTQTQRNEHALESEMNRLKQCPNCMSSDYTETRIEYEK